LAIQGLNVSQNSSDFLVSVELIGGQMGTSGSVSEKALEYTAAVSIDSTTQITARTEHQGSWSPKTGLKLWVLEGFENLKITEIHYHPLDEGDTLDNDSDYEFIELKNVGSESLDISAFHFSRGISYTFPATSTIAPSQIIVLASNAAAFQQRYEFSADGVYTGHLANSGETVALNSAINDTLIKIRYNDKYPWPGSTDGQGFSLTSKKMNPYQNPNNPERWCASSVIHGTPGQDDYNISVNPSPEKTPTDFRLFQNYPNPFNSSTTIRFTLARAAQVSLKIYNLLGQQITTLVDKHLESGSHTIHWNVAEMPSGMLPTGIYFYRLEAAGFSETRKVLLLK